MEFTEEELKCLKIFVENYASIMGHVDLEESYQFPLKYWTKNKKTLKKLLGDKLIHTIPEKINIKPPKVVLTRQARKLIDKYDSYLHKIVEKNWQSYDLLFSTENYLTNKYEGETIEATNSNKHISITNGTRTMHAINKLAEIYDIPKDENFCIEHSRILNQKNLTGYLHLSIHPLDYITMSDNRYDWSSCMSWAKAGDFRQGTIEMMNSPIAILAYFTTEENPKLEDKRWRQIFVVDESMVIASKGYPYESEKLTETVFKEILKLAKENLNWEYPEVQNLIPCELPIEFETTAMYNDFDHIFTKKPIYFKNKEIPEKIKYSGESMCVICGKILEPDEYNTYKLTCGDCDVYERCYDCGDILPYYELEEGLCRRCLSCEDYDLESEEPHLIF